ncbi:MAG: hypothetical protein EOP07_20860 [Proteobacteria bacterium]|nr:MAG: hypothetical protein EOP07_20860 [Pseudomonadota bacterium]
MKALVIASMTVLLAQGVAMAKPAHKGAAPIEALDADKDGKLSKDEVKADTALTGKFDELDANKDGFLDKDELKAAHPAGHEAPHKK